MKRLNKICKALQTGAIAEVKKYIEVALEEGIEAEKVLNEGLFKGMSSIGKKFKKNEASVAEILIAGKAMKTGMKILKPELVKNNVEASETIVLGTVKNDLHDVGKNLVKILLEGAGFDVYDLGTNVSAEEFVKAIKEKEAKVLGMSALLTTTMKSMEITIEKIKEAKIRNNVFIIIGGAPITSQFAEEIEADAYAENAASAVSLIKNCFNNQN